MRSQCKLCLQEKDLVGSHVIPKFVFRWMQKSGGKYFRTPANPNLRAQDGVTKPLLCNDCEIIFSQFETWFSKNIFYPYHDSNETIFQYDKSLSKFIISVLWRVLLLEIDRNQDETISLAFNEWREFLLHQKEPNKYKNIHLVFIPVDSGTDSQPHQYFSRYFHRASDGGLIKLGENVIVFAKLSRLFLFGELKKEGTNFRGTEVSLDFGITTQPQYILNNALSSFLITRAQDIFLNLKNSTSARQKQVINSEIEKNLESIIDSDLGERIKQDISAKISPMEFDQTFYYQCDCCNKDMREPDGYLFRTFEILQSENYWRDQFNLNNIGTDENGLKVRIEYFKSIAFQETPWVVCEECSAKYFSTRSENKEFMRRWIELRGDYLPPKCGDFRNVLNEDEIHQLIRTVLTIE